MNMKEIIAVILLLSVVEGNPSLGNIRNKRWIVPHQPPGHSFQPSEHSFQPPGHSFQPPGHSFQPPGHSFQPPGHSFQPPGHSFQPPGYSFQPPGQSFQPPGQSFQPPGQSFQPPGQFFQTPGQSFQPQEQSFQPPGQSFQNGRRHGGGLCHSTNCFPYLPQYNNVDWVCQSPNTGDTMIITSVDGTQTTVNEPSPQTGKSDNKPSTENTNLGNPKNYTVETSDSGKVSSSTSSSTSQPDTNNSSLHNGGEGLIDIRIGDK